MRSAGNVLFPLIVVALLAALTFWLQRAVNPDDPTRRALKRHDPDFVIENFTVRRFDENGNLKQSLTTLRTESLTVFPDEDIAEGYSRVTITRGQSVVSGDTVHYNGRENIAVLGGRVKGIFYRDKKS